MHYIPTSHYSHSYSHSMNFESRNSHLMNANFDQLRHIPTFNTFSVIMQNNCFPGSFKVTSFCTSGKSIFDLLLVSNTNLLSVLHHFQVISDYWSNFCCWYGMLKLRTTKLDIIELEASLHHMVLNVFWYLGLFRHGAWVWWTDIWTDGQTEWPSAVTLAHS